MKTVTISAPDASRSLKPLDKKYIILLIYTPLVVILDQVVKIYVDRSMYLYESIEVVENFFNFTYIRNKGAAFGILSGADPSLRIPFFISVSVIAIGVIIYILYTYKGRTGLYPASLSLILGGAIGNMIDRVRLGEVIDFIDVHWHGSHWPAFNIADSAITIGVSILILHMLTEKEEKS